MMMMDTLWRAVSPRLPYSLSRRPLPRSHRGLRQRLDRRLVACAPGRLICIYLYLVFSITLYLCLCSIAVTVTALPPTRLCRIAVFLVKPTFLSNQSSALQADGAETVLALRDLHPQGDLHFNKTHWLTSEQF